MRFFNRDQELADLAEIRRRSETVAQFTVVTGRPRVGKTSLVVRSLQDETYVYLFVERKSEKDLCSSFAEEINAKLGDVVLSEPGRWTRLGSWWDRKGESEIDLLCENELDSTYEVCEIKRDKCRFNEIALKEKFAAFQRSAGKWKSVNPTFVALSLEDM